jgi:hypothetical protein
MSDAQLTLILSAIGVLGGSLITALRWAVNRVTSSNDAGTTALIANTASNAVLIVKLEHLAQSILRLDDFVKEEISGVHDGPPRRTPPRGLRVARPGTHHDEGK